MDDQNLEFINREGTTLVTIFPDGSAEVATRPDTSATWGPPTILRPATASVANRLARLTRLARLGA